MLYYLTDFDCLFGKGQQLPIPETIPFRMTQNIIDGQQLGGYGTKSLFNKISQHVLRTMKKNNDLLLSSLSTFTYDPQIRWDNLHTINLSNYVENRVNGTILHSKSFCNTIELLLHEAIDPVNLSQMYIGWAPWL